MLHCTGKQPLLPIRLHARGYRHGTSSVRSQLQAQEVPPTTGVDGQVPVLQTSGQAILTTFAFPAALSGSEGAPVSVAGSFNQWQNPFALRTLHANEDLVRSVVLQPGLIQYKFIVDGTWRHSPRDPIWIDEQGSLNNQKNVAVNAVIVWRADPASAKPRQVYVSGSFLAWQELVPLQRSDHDACHHYVNCCLPSGRHHIRFLVDGEWKLCPHLPSEIDETGELSNVIVVDAMHAFHVFCNTAWLGATLKSRLLNPEGEPVSEWASTPLGPTQSRLAPWRACAVPAQRDPDNVVQPCQLEFLIEGPDGGEDRPAGGGTYRLPAPGGYKLSRGNLRPFLQACAAPFMLVSDVDGTMIDESDHGAVAAREFRDYWESSATLCSSILVYNTGRSIGQLTGLLEYRKDCMAVPDAVITAVGTKVFMLNRKVSRATANAGSWEEDLGWSRLLDQDWSLAATHAAASRCINDRCHWLDQGTEHPHRIALSVHRDDVRRVVAALETDIAAAGFKAQYIVSGVGEFRYVDVLSVHGGKRRAMDYVRGIYGVPKGRVVTAGDSGNDILMLEGDNPGIVVGNAQPALLHWALQQAQTGRIVLADKALAHGILEGLARHGLY